MRANLALVLLLGAVGVACAGRATPEPTPVPTPPGPTRTPPPTATAITTPTEQADQNKPKPGLPLSAETNDLFATSGVCGPCHTGLTDDSGKDVSIETAWRASMMANAARDPFWSAVVRAEVEANPDRRSEIEENCSTCHAPMASFSDGFLGEQPSILDGGYLDSNSATHTMAMDGVSCSLCHQIRAENLGSASSYDGGYQIDTTTHMGARPAYGPYSVEPDQSDLMQTASGFVPIQGLHLAQAEMCATCHTTFSPGAPGATDTVAVDASYFEWFYSDYRQTQSCQDCHMPDAYRGARIATTSRFPRSPFAQHTFAGGNAAVLRVLKAFGEPLGVTASDQAFDVSIEQAEELLGSETADLKFDNVRLSGSRLTADIVVVSITGHKFPTGFPSRRAWLHIVITDAAGQVRFESGAVGDDGAIVGDDNDVDPTEVEPHYEAIVSPDQVQIYEGILRDAAGHPTTSLVGAAGYIKDNRLLPVGYDEEAPNEAVAVHGRVQDDKDFTGGGDRVQLSVDLGDAAGPFTLSVELLYQPVGFRWLESIRSLSAPETTQFLGYFSSVIRTDLVASQEVEVGS
jgi:mono/diheme cytochrome c family protein